MRIKQRIAALAFAAAAVVGTGVAADVALSPSTSPARADECTIQTGRTLCGKIGIMGQNTIWLVHEWGIYDNRGQGGYFRPGTWSTDVWKDTDGFVTRPGWCTDVRQYAQDGYSWVFLGTYGQGPTKLGDNLNEYYVWTWDC